MQRQLAAADSRVAEPARRAAFWLAVSVAATVHWIPHFPPQIDLAQHAAQIRMLHDWTSPAFRHRNIVELNFFTPYLPAYLLGALLTFVMSAVAAVKLLWTLSVLGTVAACVHLRRLFGGDSEWDWLLLPGLFGVTFQWGFLTFMMAVPLTLWFVAFWYQYLQAPSRTKAVTASVLLLLLFFSHALATAWTMMVCALMLLGDAKPSSRAVRELLSRGLPLLAPLPVALLWRGSTPPSTQASTPVIWDWSGRYLKFFSQWIGTSDHLLALLLGLSLVVLPFAAGARLSRDPIRRAPLVITLLILFVAPHWVFDVAFTYNRFFSLLAPALILAIAESSPDVRRRLTTRWLLPFISTGHVLVIVSRMMAFADEQRPFVRLLQSVPPGQHLLSIIENPASIALGTASAYIHFPVWYQAETGGFVQPSFADYLPMIVRFRAHYERPVPRQFEFGATLGALGDRASRFDGVLVRSTPTAPVSVPTRLRLMARNAEWRLYSTRTAPAEPGASK